MHYTKIHMLHLTLLRGGSEPCHYKVFNEQPRAAAVEERGHKSSRQIISEKKFPGSASREHTVCKTHFGSQTREALSITKCHLLGLVWVCLFVFKLGKEPWQRARTRVQPGTKAKAARADAGVLEV